MSEITAVDLFCGAGGASEGMRQSGVTVLAAVNHDPEAIAAHTANHPDTTHYNEDVRTFNVGQLPAKVNLLWMSAECTHLSNAKGGQPRSADSRTLSEELPRYVRACDPDYIFVENVVEFLSWGPLDAKGKPVRKLNGRDYIRWVKSITSMGYSYEYRVLDSADFGAYTSRSRFFGIFAKKGLSIRFPRPTHAKKVTVGSLFDNPLKKWQPVKEVLNLSDHGNSIFTGRGKMPLLSANTLARIEYGLNKFSTDPESTCLMNHTFSNPPQSVNEPIGTILASRRHWYKVSMIDRYIFGSPPTGLGQPLPTKMASRDQYLTSAYLTMNYSCGGEPVAVQSIDRPINTISTKDRFQLTKVNFFQYYYGGGAGNSDQRVTSLGVPINTITTSANCTLITGQFIANYYSGGGQVTALGSPCPTLMTVPKQRLITGFIDVAYGAGMASGKYNVRSLDRPIGAITVNPHQAIVHGIITGAADAKSKPFIVRLAGSMLEVPGTRVENVKIKGIWHLGYRVSNSIQDVFMRMLNVSELKAAQGFPLDYKLLGSETLKKKHIGNSVVPLMAKLLTEANLAGVPKGETCAA